MPEKDIKQLQKLDKINYNNYKYLFLDRDGVINVERPNDYAKTIDEFVFIDGATEAIALLSQFFDKILIITNQRGISKGLYTHQDLSAIHNYMVSEIEKQGGRIDKIYYCPDPNSSSINRKPNIGMGFQALADFPKIDFKQSIFVGNSKSDMLFSNKLDMLSVLVGDKYPQGHIIYKIINVYCENLYKFAHEVKEHKTITK